VLKLSAILSERSTKAGWKIFYSSLASASESGAKGEGGMDNGIEGYSA